MNHYTITLHNEKRDLWDEQVVEKYTFPEAVMIANLTKSNLGYEWSIVSIYKNNKGVKNARR